MGAYTLRWASLLWPRTEVCCSLNVKCSQRLTCPECYCCSIWVWAPSPSLSLIQGLCRETLRCPLTAPPNQPLHCRRASPQGDRCILGWPHISRTTPWVATGSKEDSMAPKVCASELYLSGFDLRKELFFVLNFCEKVSWNSFYRLNFLRIRFWLLKVFHLIHY